jgi:hypothetical protein
VKKISRAVFVVQRRAPADSNVGPAGRGALLVLGRFLNCLFFALIAASGYECPDCELRWLGCIRRLVRDDDSNQSSSISIIGGKRNLTSRID